MKTLFFTLILLISSTVLGQQQMITYDSLHNETENVELGNPIKMTAHYDEGTTEIVLTSHLNDNSKREDKFLVKGITTTESFKIYHPKNEEVMFEVVIGENYFILDYGDHYDVFPQ
jgi:hypothetical protein